MVDSIRRLTQMLQLTNDDEIAQLASTNPLTCIMEIFSCFALNKKIILPPSHLDCSTFFGTKLALAASNASVLITNPHSAACSVVHSLKFLKHVVLIGEELSVNTARYAYFFLDL